MFRIAYGRDPMSNESCDTLLYCQLQEGLCYELMRGPARYQEQQSTRSYVLQPKMRKSV